MIVYGTKPVHVKTEQVNNITCPNCKTNNSTIFSIYSKHAYLYWIPFFPYGKTAVSECQNCKAQLTQKEMPIEFKNEAIRLKSESKTPLWQFSGLVLLAVLIPFVIYTSKKNDKKELEYIQNPVIGDVYTYELEDGNYSTLKVNNVTFDSVFILQNDYEINKSHKTYKIDKEENYSNEAYGIPREEINSMYLEKTILSVDRD